MSEKTFKSLMWAITVIGTAVTVSLVIYTAYLYSNCSIISFIANGR